MNFVGLGSVLPSPLRVKVSPSSTDYSTIITNRGRLI